MCIRFMLILLCLPPLTLAAAEPEEELQQAEIKALVEQLGNISFAKRAAATQQLREIGRPAHALLHQAAMHGNLEVRSRALQVLAETDPAMLYFAALSSGDIRTRTTALRSLAGYRREILVPTLIQLLKTAPENPRGDTQREYFKALLDVVGFQQNRKAIPELSRLLLASRGSYADPVEEIVSAMAKIADPAAADALLKYAKTRTQRVADTRLNEALALAMGGTRDARCVAPMLDLVEHPYDGYGSIVVHQAAIIGLAKIGPVAVPKLAEEWAGRSSFVRKAIAIALGRIGGEDAREVLAGFLKDDTTYEAAVALDRLGDPRGAAHIQDAFELLLASGESPPQQLTLALAQCSHSSLQSLCRRLLKTKTRATQWSAAECLARQKDDTGLEFLREQLKNENDAATAIRVLTRVGDDASTTTIARLAKNSKQQDIVQAAIPGLAALKNQEAAAALISMVKGSRSERGYAELRRDSARVLAAYPVQEVVDVLIASLKEEEGKVAQSAYYSLADIVGDRLIDADHWRRWWKFHRREFPKLDSLR